MKIEDYNEYYIQGSDHYLIPKDVFMELFNEMINWKEKSKKQKEKINKIKDLLIIKKSRCLSEDDYILNVLDLDEILDKMQELEGSDSDE